MKKVEELSISHFKSETNQQYFKNNDLGEGPCGGGNKLDGLDCECSCIVHQLTDDAGGVTYDGINDSSISSGDRTTLRTLLFHAFHKGALSFLAVSDGFSVHLTLSFLDLELINKKIYGLNTLFIFKKEKYFHSAMSF